ncbi:ubiquitin C-terminal hydrolase [Cryptosporidium felis]|nr:ubiquitin C-terminal hydrolase [Cryptosporidium felis]
MSGEWCTIESDPGVFTELAERYGVRGVQFAEIYDFSQEGVDELISEYKNVYGVIFLFKFTEKTRSSYYSQPQKAPQEMFFANQVINNACATQAILSIILNRRDVDIGAHLEEFKGFSSSFDPMTKGLVIGNSEVLRSAHNSFRPNSSLEIADPKDSGNSKGDAFHYICYVPFEDSVYELDGLAPGVVNLGSLKNGDFGDFSGSGVSALYDKPRLWVSRVIAEVKRRIDLQNVDGSQEEIRFSLMAVVPDKITTAEKRIQELKKTKKASLVKLLSLNEEFSTDEEDFSEEELELDELEAFLASVPDNPDEIKQEISKIRQEISINLSLIQNEKLNRQVWKKENERRRHDFLPFVLTLLRHASKKGLLVKKLSQLQ